MVGYEDETLGEMLARLMGERGLKQTELAERVGMTQTWISKVFSGDIKTVTDAKLAEFITALDASSEDKQRLRRLAAVARVRGGRTANVREVLYDLMNIPVLGQTVSASLERGTVIEYTTVTPADRTAHPGMVAVRVSGDCLAPVIEDGDLVLVDRDMTARNGSYVFASIDEQLHLKRLEIRDGRYFLTCNDGEEGISPEQIEGVVFKVTKDLA